MNPAALAVLLICLLSCSSPKGKNDDYFPLSDGIKMDYSVVFSPGGEKGRFMYRVEGEEIINGKKYYKSVTTPIGIPLVQPQTIYYRKSDKGVYAIDQKHKDLPEYLHMPYPLETGVDWISKPPGGDLHYRVEGVENVKLTNRSYEKCIKVSYKSDMVSGYYFVAKDVGIIKYVLLGDDGPVFEMTLDQYEH